MKHFGIIGWPVSYSKSPEIHNAAFRRAGLDWDYCLLPTKPEELESAIQRFRADNFRGANVTIPHKKTIMVYLDGFTKRASEIGAVNTLFWQDGQLMGDNTDAHGFLADLAAKGVDMKGKPVLILGAGGSSKAIRYALEQAGANPINTWTRRSGGIPKPAYLTVNCTPGLDPEVLARTEFKPGQILYDLVYVPEETPLMQKARAAGTRVFNGYGMLLEQAAESFRVWRNQEVG
jgi:shikimate dehydrogenase